MNFRIKLTCPYSIQYIKYISNNYDKQSLRNKLSNIFEQNNYQVVLKQALYHGKRVSYNHIHLHILTLTFIHLHIHTFTHLHNYTFSFTHSYIHTFIHSYIHTLTHSFFLFLSFFAFFCVRVCGRQPRSET